jgi:hypothetical protein
MMTSFVVQDETDSMIDSLDAVRTLQDLRSYVHHVLCRKENLVAEQFTMREMQLVRRGRMCGLQFSIYGPRCVRLGAVWASDHNQLYFYDAQGNRFGKECLRQRLLPEAQAG